MSDPIEVKLVVVGETSVGKTSILQRYVEGRMDEQMSTIGACCLEKTVEINQRKYAISLWDTAGQEAYRAIVPMYFRGASIALIVADISNYMSIDRIPYWIDLVNQNIENDNLIIAVVINKIDLQKDKSDEQEIIQQLHIDTNAIFFTSALNGVGIDSLFEYILNKFDEKMNGTAQQEEKQVEIIEKPKSQKGCSC